MFFGILKLQRDFKGKFKILKNKLQRELCQSKKFPLVGHAFFQILKKQQITKGLKGKNN
jgi:hypothetical protein